MPQRESSLTVASGSCVMSFECFMSATPFMLKARLAHISGANDSAWHSSAKLTSASLARPPSMQENRGVDLHSACAQGWRYSQLQTPHG